MTREYRLEISIYIAGKEYAMRVWPAIPRVGDEIMVRRIDPISKAVLDENGIVVVKDVCWGTSKLSRESPWSECRVSLFCEWRL